MSKREQKKKRKEMYVCDVGSVDWFLAIDAHLSYGGWGRALASVN
ncbi:MAG: hypothetical protein ACPLIG_05895 [Candidatus Bathyarchaeales archaeon]